MKIGRSYTIISNFDEQSIMYKNQVSLIFSKELLQFFFSFPQLTFDGAVGLKMDINKLIYSFCSVINILNIFNDDAWIEHFQYSELVNKTRVLPFASGLTWDYFYFIGAGNENLNNIYLYVNSTKDLIKIAENIEEFLKEKIQYDLQFG